MTNSEQAKTIKKTKVVLDKYHNYYPKTAADGSLSAPKLNWAPNHPSVVPMNLDNQILRNLNAKDYCWSIQHVVKRMRSYGYIVYAAILHNKYLVVDPIANIDQARRMHVSKKTFYRKLDTAVYTFAQMMPNHIMDKIYLMATRK